MREHLFSRIKAVLEQIKVNVALFYSIWPYWIMNNVLIFIEMFPTQKISIKLDHILNIFPPEEYMHLLYHTITASHPQPQCGHSTDTGFWTTEQQLLLIYLSFYGRYLQVTIKVTRSQLFSRWAHILRLTDMSAPLSSNITCN